jgi:DNA primase
VAPWWLEEEGYTQELDFRQQKRQAKASLAKVLRRLGVEFDEDAYDEWQAVRCPFHDDTRASASIKLRKGWFNCHGCGISGSTISIIKSSKGLSEKESVEWIGKL